MSDIKEKCTACDHRTTCKYSEDYILFKNKILELSNKLDGNIIAEGVAQVEIKCKYFRPNIVYRKHDVF